MKKYYYTIFICCSFFTNIFSQEIRIKRQFFIPSPQYYSGEQYIGNSTQELSYFIETHRKDSVIIKLLNESDRGLGAFSKITFYSGITTGIGGLGFSYVFIKGFSLILKPNSSDPALSTIAYTSLGLIGLGAIGLTVGGGYFISSQIKLRKAIKGYNKAFQTEKITLNFQPYFQPNVAGLTVKFNF